jgi:hypothetical protein
VNVRKKRHLESSKSTKDKEGRLCGKRKILFFNGLKYNLKIQL